MRWIKVGVVASLTVGGLVGGWIALERTGIVGVTQIKVIGEHRLGAATIRDASGIEIGDNAFSLDLEAAARRVEDLPLVAAAEISRDGTLGVLVRIEERTAAFIVDAADGPQTIDADGVPVGAPPPGRLLPTITDGVPDAVVLDAIGRIWSGMTRSERRVARFDAAERIVLRLTNRTIIFGSADEPLRKLTVYRGVVSRLRGLAATVDLTDPARPAARSIRL